MSILQNVQQTLLSLELKQCSGLFPTATHRHYKGGLYRYICEGLFTEHDAAWMLGKKGVFALTDEHWEDYDGDPEQTEALMREAGIVPIEKHMVVYQHIFPHKKEIFIRPVSMFYGQEPKAPGPHHLRFTPLHNTVPGRKRLS